MKDKNTNEYFIIKQHKWSNHTTYEIMKSKPFDLTQAIRLLLAYEQLNDQEEISLEELSNIENEISGDDKYTFELQIINMLKNLK